MTRCCRLARADLTPYRQRTGTDLAYFAREDLTRRWLLGDKLVTAGAIAAEQLGTHLAGPSRAQVGRHSGSVLRHAARYAGKAMSAGHGMAAAGAAAVTAAAVATVVIAWPAGQPGPAQFTGIQLASALLPSSELPAGYSYTFGLNDDYNSGSSLVTPSAHPTGPVDYSCSVLRNGDGLVLSTRLAQMTGYAGNWGTRPPSLALWSSPSASARLFISSQVRHRPRLSSQPRVPVSAIRPGAVPAI